MAKYKDEEWLRREYLEKGRNGTDIADECGCHHQNIYYYLDKFDIPKRSRGFRMGERHYNYSNAKSEYECTWCGKAFMRQDTHVEKLKHGPYCSNECHQAHMSVYRSGEGNHQYGLRGEENPTSGKDHPLWKGGEDRSWHGTAEWRDARREVLERDGYECVDCGITREEHNERLGQDLECHHKTPVREGGAKFDPDNLVTLCKPCHKARHRKVMEWPDK